MNDGGARTTGRGCREGGSASPLFWERAGADWFWRGMFELIPLPLSWPVLREPCGSVGVRGLARPRAADRSGVSARRVRHAGGSPSAAIPGATRSRRRRAACSTSRAGIPSRLARIRRAGACGASMIWSATAGSGRARCSRRSRGSVRCRRIPRYSADFFDGEHFVMKGASPATARELLRPTFRNWFRPRYPYVYATFRCVRPAGGGDRR